MSHRDIPGGEMRLTRVLTRGLHDAESIVVKRSWAVRFAHQNQGIAISGNQLSAKVEAPVQLERFAQIEETRSTDTMFPILLASTGMMLAAGQTTHRDDLEAAVREAEAIIASRQISESAKASQRRYLAQLQSTAGKLLDRLPPDLFYPSAIPHETVEQVDLPDGLKGEFELTYESKASSRGEWLERAERRVVTRIGRSQRLSSEVWAMTPA